MAFFFSWTGALLHLPFNQETFKMVLQDHLFLQNLLFVQGLLIVTDANMSFNIILCFHILSLPISLYTICTINKHIEAESKRHSLISSQQAHYIWSRTYAVFYINVIILSKVEILDGLLQYTDNSAAHAKENMIGPTITTHEKVTTVGSLFLQRVHVQYFCLMDQFSMPIIVSYTSQNH